MAKPNVAAENADRALRVHGVLTGGGIGNNAMPREEQVTDLITDLMHYCTLHDLDFPSMVNNAHYHHTDEQENNDAE